MQMVLITTTTTTVTTIMSSIRVVPSLTTFWRPSKQNYLIYAYIVQFSRVGLWWTTNMATQKPVFAGHVV